MYGYLPQFIHHEVDFFSSPPVEKLHSLSGEGWTVFLLQLCSSLEEPNPSTPPLSATAARSKLNLLCYLCCVAGHKVIANKLINSTLVGLLFTLGWV